MTGLVRCGEPLRVTVRVSSELSMATIPPGVMSRTSRRAAEKLRYFHDFFNYAGLHRSVWLYSTPQSYVAGLAVGTAYDPATSAGQVTYHLDVAGPGPTSVRAAGRGRGRGGRGQRPGRRAGRARGPAVEPRRPASVPAGRPARRRRVLPAGGHQDRPGGRGPAAAQRGAGPAARFRHARGRRAARQGPRRRADGPRLRAAAVDRRQLVPDLPLPVRRGGARLRRPAGPAGDRRDPGRRPAYEPGEHGRSRGADLRPRA